MSRRLAISAAALLTMAAPGEPATAAADVSAASDGFSAPVRIDDAASVASVYAAIAVDAHGDAVAVWSHRTTSRTIYGARRPAGGAWSAPVELTADYGDGPDTVALAADGTAYFDAISRDDDGDHILAWRTDGTVTDTGVAGHDDAGEVATGAAGDVVAYAVNPSHAITYRYARAGASGWTSATTIHFFGISTVALAPRHTYFVAYTPSTVRRGSLVRVRKVNGLTGHSAPVLRRRMCAMGDVSSLDAFRPYDIAAASTGAAVLSWRCSSRSGQSISALRIGAGGRVGRVEVLASSRRKHVATRLSPPRIAFDGRTATIVFSRATGHGYRDVLATSSRGARWTRPSVKAAHVRAARITGMEGHLAARADGAALFTYRDGTAVYALRRLPGATFAPPVRVFRASDLHSAAPGAIAGDGTATVLQLVNDARLRSRTER